jgi:hypothetical protein
MSTDGFSAKPTLDGGSGTGGGEGREWAAGQRRLCEKAEALAAAWDAHAQELREDYAARRRPAVGPGAAALVIMLTKHAADLRAVLEAGATFATTGPDGMTEYTCHACGVEFRSNCSAGDIECTNCEARLCSYCGEWDQELIY